MKRPSIASSTRAILSEHGIQLKKSLGQNFLTDTDILQQIVKAASLKDSSLVLEVGPGIGALTEQLADVARQVIAVEIDQRLLSVLRQTLQYRDNVDVVHGDILQVDLGEIIRRYEARDVHVVANLPYYITSPVITRLLSLRYPFKNIVVMVQKEVAERLVARPGGKEYGSLSVWVSYFAEAKIVMKVPRHVFAPPPKVESAVVVLTPRESPPVKLLDEDLFFQVIRASFAQRRKTLLNSLSSVLGVPKEPIGRCVEEVGIDPRRRGETLTLDEFARLANAILKGNILGV